jgi:hypothetical protein
MWPPLKAAATFGFAERFFGGSPKFFTGAGASQRGCRGHFRKLSPQTPGLGTLNGVSTPLSFKHGAQSLFSTARILSSPCQCARQRCRRQENIIFQLQRSLDSRRQGLVSWHVPTAQHRERARACGSHSMRHTQSSRRYSKEHKACLHEHICCRVSELVV